MSITPKPEIGHFMVKDRLFLIAVWLASTGPCILQNNMHTHTSWASYRLHHWDLLLEPLLNFYWLAFWSTVITYGSLNSCFDMYFICIFDMDHTTALADSNSSTFSFKTLKFFPGTEQTHLPVCIQAFRPVFMHSQWTTLATGSAREEISEQLDCLTWTLPAVQLPRQNAKATSLRGLPQASFFSPVLLI